MAAVAPERGSLFHLTQSGEKGVRGHRIGGKGSDTSLLETQDVDRGDRGDSGYCVTEKTPDAVSLNDFGQNVTRKTTNVVMSQREVSDENDSRYSIVWRSSDAGLLETDDVELLESERNESQQAGNAGFLETDDVERGKSVPRNDLDVLLDQELVQSYDSGLGVPREVSHDEGFRSRSDTSLMENIVRLESVSQQDIVPLEEVVGHDSALSVPLKTSDAAEPQMEDIELSEDNDCDFTKVGIIEPLHLY